MTKNKNNPEVLNTQVTIGCDINMQSVTVPLSDFEKFEVGMVNAADSSAFVISLCHQLNIRVGNQEIGRAPWSYTPYHIQIKDVAVVCMGNVSTKLGVFTVVIECRNKKTIDHIYFYNLSGAHLYKSDELCEIVEEAIRLRNDTQSFVYRAKLSFNKDIEIAYYYGENFKTFAVRKESFVEFQVKAIDIMEANDLARQKLSLFCHFLALDTNIIACYSEFEKINAPIAHGGKPMMKLYPPFIDGSPISENLLYLTEYGAKFINTYIFTPRTITENRIAQNILSASSHIYDGLCAEGGIEEEVKFVGPNFVFSEVPVKYKSQDLCTKSIMSYMSAVEIATINEGKSDKCEKCGTELYHITARVKDIASKYLSYELGRIFGILYSMRSKYLHAGIFSTGFDQGHPRPVFDPDSPNLLVPRQFVTIKKDGRSLNLYVSNVREWTTFLLRAYLGDILYNKKITIEDVATSAGSYHPVQTLKPLIKSALPGVEIHGFIIT